MLHRRVNICLNAQSSSVAILWGHFSWFRIKPSWALTYASNTFAWAGAASTTRGGAMASTSTSTNPATLLGIAPHLACFASGFAVTSLLLVRCE